MDGVAKFFVWSIVMVFAILGTGHAKEATMTLAKMAAHAHLYDQMSYSKFTKELLGAHVRSKRSHLN